MDLRSYEQFKFELAELIRSGQLFASRETTDSAKRRDSERPWVSLLTRLAEDRFTVVLAGRFNQGKSSLINALLGLDRLPTGVVPLTSVIMYVRYGAVERVLIDYEDNALPGKATLAQLPEYVTETGNPGNIKQIRSVEIQLPSEILRRGVLLVDTPGLGSAVLANAETTERFIPEIDVLILVTSYPSPLSEDEIRFVRQASGSIRAVFAVINKHDTVATVDRAEVIEYIERSFRRALGYDAPKLFSVSAKDGLTAKLAGDSEALRTSGISNFETALMQFLLRSRSTLFLSAMCDRTRGELNLLPRQEGESLVSRLDALQQRLKLDEIRTSDAERDSEVLITPVARDSGFPSVEVCEICSEVVEREFDFLAHQQYDLSTRSEAQEHHAAHDGYCPFHTWQYVHLASKRDICVAYPMLLEATAARLRSVATNTADGAYPDLLIDSQCPVCNLQRTTEDEMVESLLRRSGEAANRRDPAESTLCLPHLQLILRRSDDQSLRQHLMLREAAIIERVAEDMRRYAIKHDGIRRALVSEEELAAPLKALQILAAHKNVNGVPSSR